MEGLRGEHACSRLVIGAALRVHSALGPGLLESAYEACLVHELRMQGCGVEAQVSLPVVYHGVEIDVGYRLDLLVDDMVVVELKSLERIRAVHRAQLLSYLRLSGHPIGLLLNFHVPRLKEGITRILNDRARTAPRPEPSQPP